MFAIIVFIVILYVSSVEQRLSCSAIAVLDYVQGSLKAAIGGSQIIWCSSMPIAFKVIMIIIGSWNGFDRA